MTLTVVGVAGSCTSQAATSTGACRLQPHNAAAAITVASQVRELSGHPFNLSGIPQENQAMLANAQTHP